MLVIKNISWFQFNFQKGGLAYTAGKGLFKWIKHVSRTLSNIVGMCWKVFDQCWIALDAGVFK